MLPNTRICNIMAQVYHMAYTLELVHDNTFSKCF